MYDDSQVCPQVSTVVLTLLPILILPLVSWLDESPSLRPVLGFGASIFVSPCHVSLDAIHLLLQLKDVLVKATHDPLYLCEILWIILGRRDLALSPLDWHRRIALQSNFAGIILAFAS